MINGLFIRRSCNFKIFLLITISKLSKMKRLRLLLAAMTLLVLSVQVAQAQVKLGDNPGSIDANALLELESTTKGFLLPRMSTVQRLAMPSPTEGMMVYDLTANCTYIYRASAGQWYSLCSADSLTASNGLTKVGRDIQLGGTLTQITNINQAGNNLNLTGAGSLGVGTNSPTAKIDVVPASGADPLALQSLRGGVSTDSIVTVNAATGILRKRTLADVLSDQDTLVWKLDGNLTTAVRSLGTKSNFALPIITNNVERMRIAATGEVGIGTSSPTNKLTVEASADPLKLVGLQTAAQTDSLLTINAVTGVVRKITIDSVASRGIVAENGVNKQGNIVRLGGNLNRATSINTDATNTLAVAGLQSASSADSVVLADKTTGVLRRMTLADVGSNSFTANNGLTKTANNVKLGGTLVDANTVIAAGASNTLAITGLQTAAMTDSLITQDAATGILRKITIDSVASRGVVANNGLTKTGNVVQLGGTLLHATTVDQATYTMAYTNGNVGIGSTTAAERLTVAAGNVSIANTGTVTTTMSDGTTTGQIKVTGNNTELSSTGSSGLQLSTGATPAARMTVTQAGLVGVGTAAPNASFEVVGSVANSISTKSGAYTAALTDHTIVADCSSAGFTLTLPAASSCPGRTYIIIKGDESNNVLAFSTPISLSTTRTMPSVNYNVRLHIQSDGTNWWLVARF